MDNLAKCAFLARQNGMSYGQYMALYRPPKPPRPKVKKLAEKKPDKLCKECGNPIVQKKGVRPQIFCCVACCMRWHGRNKNRKAEIPDML